jgi:hypothetical protein
VGVQVKVDLDNWLYNGRLSRNRLCIIWLKSWHHGGSLTV